MLYQTYEARRALTAPLLGIAAVQSATLRHLPTPLASSRSARTLRAASETVSALTLTHRRPPFGIDATTVGGNETPVREDVVARTAFASLLRFSKEGVTGHPKVLVVPGLAGHFATLARGTIRALLPDHDVYITDWHNARDVAPSHGRFGLDEYIEHLISFLDEIGPGAHLLAVCQPCVPVLAAAAIMSEDDHPAKPASIVLIAGPVDARVNPGRVNQFATRTPLEKLERRAVTTVSWPHQGAGRRVYPGFLQVSGFMGLAPRRHISAFTGLFRDIAAGREDQAETMKTFYDEYFAVLDVAAEYYLETARVVFQDHDFARGAMYWKGRLVDPAAIDSALLTIEGGKDEMCPPGQTEAAHALCTGIPAKRHKHHLQADVGHYGVFTGSRFTQEIYPVIKRFVATRERARASA